MSPVDRTEQWLGDFLKFADDARDVVVADGKASFLGDRRTQLAAEAILHKLGESVARLPSEFVDGHPQVPWKVIKAMRDVVAHEYGAIDYEIVWTALADRLPDDAAEVRKILGT